MGFDTSRLTSHNVAMSRTAPASDPDSRGRSAPANARARARPGEHDSMRRCRSSRPASLCPNSFRTRAKPLAVGSRFLPRWAAFERCILPSGVAAKLRDRGPAKLGVGLAFQRAGRNRRRVASSYPVDRCREAHIYRRICHALAWPVASAPCVPIRYSPSDPRRSAHLQRVDAQVVDPAIAAAARRSCVRSRPRNRQIHGVVVVCFLARCLTRSPEPRRMRRPCIFDKSYRPALPLECPSIHRFLSRRSRPSRKNKLLL